MGPLDFINLALSSSRDTFSVTHQFPFIISGGKFLKRRGPGKTIRESIETLERPTEDDSPGSDQEASPLFVCAVRKVQVAFPSMITVGRTLNNDVVIDDVMISKFHAFFRPKKPNYLIIDAGSLNGTWVRAHRLPPKGDGEPVSLNDELSFGGLRFLFVDAKRCWEEVHRLVGGRSELPK